MLISRLRPVELDMTVVYEVVISFVDPVAALAVMGRATAITTIVTAKSKAKCFLLALLIVCIIMYLLLRKG